MPQRWLHLARRHAALAGVLALSAILRVPWLGAVPGPCGDEGNWPFHALAIARGQPAGLAPEARFVTMAFAHLIALSFRFLGASFASARAVPVAAVLVGIAVAYVLAARVHGRSAAVVVASLLAVHPWSVLWSRSSSVPYALSLALAVVGPLAFLAAIARKPRPGPVAIVLAGQLLFAGFHFSPLAVVPVAACTAWILVPGRSSVLRSPWTWIALGLGALHLVPVGQGMSQALHGGGARHGAFADRLGERLGDLARMVVGSLGGEGTAAHFASSSTWHLVLAGTIAMAVGVVALGVALRERAGLARFGALYLGVALVGLPVVLLPGRDWHMPTIDAERYGFVLLAPLALLLAGAAQARPRCAWLALGFVGFLLVVPTARTARALLVRGGPDQGLFTSRGGGGYRGWKVPRERRALAEVLREAMVRDAHGEPATFAAMDYSFHAFRFANAAAGPGNLGYALGRTEFPRGARLFYVTWDDSLFALGFEPGAVVEANRALRSRVLTQHDDVHLVRRIVQVGGAPLCELWSARAR